MSRGLRLAVILAFLVGVFVFAINNLKEADSFYHLSAGRLIWETRSIPQVDVFSLTAAGRRWIAHEWLAEAAFYGIWRMGGYWALILFCAALAGLTYFLILRRALLAGGGLVVSATLLFLVGWPTLELWIPRPQVFAYLAFAAELYFLERYRCGGSRIWLYLTVPLVLVWANFHASVVLGLAVLLLYALGAILKKRAPENFGPPLAGERPVPLGSAFILGTLASLINPSGFRIWTYSFTVWRTLSVLKVEEWQPIQNFFATDIGASAFALEVVAVSAILIWQFVRSQKDRDITSLGLVLGTGLMPFISVRHVAWWPLAAAAPLSVLVAGFLWRWQRMLTGAGVAKVFIGAAAVLAALGAWRMPLDYFNQDTVPVYAADFIQRVGLRGPFFNFYNHGGYLTWRFYPQEKVFIDGRSEVFSGNPAAEYLAIARGTRWQELANDKYHLNYFILPYRPSGIGLSLFPLYRKLIESGWIFVYWDDAAVIFVRPVSQNLPLAARFAIRYVGPWTDPTAIPVAMRPAAALELQNLLNRAPYSLVIRDYAGRFLASFRSQ